MSSSNLKNSTHPTQMYYTGAQSSLTLFSGFCLDAVLQPTKLRKYIETSAAVKQVHFRQVARADNTLVLPTDDSVSGVNICTEITQLCLNAISRCLFFMAEREQYFALLPLLLATFLHVKEKPEICRQLSHSSQESIVDSACLLCHNLFSSRRRVGVLTPIDPSRNPFWQDRKDLSC